MRFMLLLLFHPPMLTRTQQGAIATTVMAEPL
jgi:hypothetical protein